MNLLKNTLITLLLLTSLPAAQSIANLLADYEMVIKKDIQSVTDSNLSGVAFDPNTGTLMVVDNQSLRIHEITTSGQLVNSIRLQGFNDVEGIAFQNDNYFLVSEERNGNVVRIKLPQSRSGSIKLDDCQILYIQKDTLNSGLEDVTYVSSRSSGFAIKEKGPTILFRIIFDNTGKPVEYQEISTFSWSGLDGDAAGIYALADGYLLILNEMGKKIIGMDSTGKILSEIKIDMNQPEGITCNEDDNTIYVVGEKREMAILKLKSKIEVRERKSVRISLHNSMKITLYNKEVLDKGGYTLHGRCIRYNEKYSKPHCASQFIIINSFNR